MRKKLVTWSLESVYCTIQTMLHILRWKAQRATRFSQQRNWHTAACPLAFALGNSAEQQLSTQFTLRLHFRCLLSHSNFHELVRNKNFVSTVGKLRKTHSKSGQRENNSNASARVKFERVSKNKESSAFCIRVSSIWTCLKKQSTRNKQVQHLYRINFKKKL